MDASSSDPELRMTSHEPNQDEARLPVDTWRYEVDCLGMDDSSWAKTISDALEGDSASNIGHDLHPAGLVLHGPLPMLDDGWGEVEAPRGIQDSRPTSNEDIEALYVLERNTHALIEEQSVA